jgi:hypothetical protein
MAGTFPNFDESDLERRIRTYLNDTDSNFYSQHNLWTWLSLAVKDIAQKSTCVRRILDAQTTTATREISYNAAKVFYVQYNPTSGRAVSLSRIDPLRVGHYNINGATPQYWYEYKGKIGIEPIPDKAYNLLLYVSDVPKMAISTITDFTSLWSGSGWTCGASAVHTGSASTLTYSTSLTSSTNYTINFTVSGMGTGISITPSIGATAGVTVYNNGLHTQNIMSPSSAPSLTFSGVGAVTLKSVSIYKEADFASTLDQIELTPTWQNSIIMNVVSMGLNNARKTSGASLID